MSDEIIKYSEAFKIRVVKELESGRFRSQNEAKLFYGLGNSTIKSWILRYGRNHLLKKVIRVETPEEKNQVKMLKKRIRELEHALADAKLAELMERSFLEVACERLGHKDVAEFKKKVNGTSFIGGS